MRKRPLLWLLCGPAVLAFTHCGSSDDAASAGDDDDGAVDSGDDDGADDASSDAPADRRAPPPRGLEAIQVAAGDAHTCAVQSTGDVYCWGSNEFGQLGISLDVAASSVPHLVELPAGIRAVQLAAGAAHTCILTDRASVVCWGRNDAGQLAQPASAVAAPGAAVLPSALTTAAFVAVAAGRAHTCAVYIQPQAGDAGEPDADAPAAILRLACWGDNATGQLARADVSRSELPGTVYRGANPVVARSVALGGDFSVANLRVGDTYRVQAWGAAGAGQLGIALGDDAGARPAPGSVYLADGGTLDDAIDLSAGAAHACASLRFAASDAGTTAPSDAGEGLLDAGADADLDAAAADASDAAGLATADVEVFCWGANDHGELARGAASATELPGVVARTVAPDARLFVGGSTTCVLEAGALRCAGANDEGQLGIGAADVAPHATLEPVLGLDGLTQTAASVGARHACSLVQISATAAQVACWGDNHEGQLGDAMPLGDGYAGATADRYRRTLPVFVVPAED